MRKVIMKNKCVLLMAALLLGPQSAVADLIVLRSGSQMRGVLANREQFRSARGFVEVVAILPDSTSVIGGKIQRIARGDIEYVALEEPDGRKQVFDMDLVSMASIQVQLDAQGYGSAVRRRRASPGIGLSLFGAGIAIVGAVAKFGPPELVATETTLRYDNKSYNGLNYGMMVGGAVFCVAGAVWATTSSRATVAIVPSPESVAQLAVYIRF